MRVEERRRMAFIYGTGKMRGSRCIGRPEKNVDCIMRILTRSWSVRPRSRVEFVALGIVMLIGWAALVSISHGRRAALGALIASLVRNMRLSSPLLVTCQLPMSIDKEPTLLHIISNRPEWVAPLGDHVFWRLIVLSEDKHCFALECSRHIWQAE